MTVYADSSALVKLFVEEPGSEEARGELHGRPWTTARHAYVEVRRAVALALDPAANVDMRDAFERAWGEATVVELDEETCRQAASIAEQAGARTLDALHLGAATRSPGLAAFVTFDRRQADVARALGLDVRGA